MANQNNPLHQIYFIYFIKRYATDDDFSVISPVLLLMCDKEVVEV